MDFLRSFLRWRGTSDSVAKCRPFSQVNNDVDMVFLFDCVAEMRPYPNGALGAGWELSICASCRQKAGKASCWGYYIFISERVSHYWLLSWGFVSSCSTIKIFESSWGHWQIWKRFADLAYSNWRVPRHGIADRNLRTIVSCTFTSL